MAETPSFFGSIMAPDLRAFLLEIEPDLRAAVDFGTILASLTEDLPASSASPSLASCIERIARIQHDHLVKLFVTWIAAEQATKNTGGSHG